MKPPATFRNVVYLDGDSANEVFASCLYRREPDGEGLETFTWYGPYPETIAATVARLRELDSGDGRVSDAPAAGEDDSWERAGEYVLTWSFGRSSVGLEQIVLDEVFLGKFVAGYVIAGRKALAARRTMEISETARLELTADCEEFLRDVALMGDCLRNVDEDPGQLGRDFWPAQDGTRPGLCDQRRYPGIAGHMLQAAAKKRGHAWFTVTDDGRIGYERGAGR